MADFKETLSRAITYKQNAIMGCAEGFNKVMAGYNPSSFCAGYLYAMQTVKGVLTQMPDAEDVVRCRECVYCRDNTICFRKVKKGNPHCIDRVHANFYCAAGKRRKEDGC